MTRDYSAVPLEADVRRAICPLIGLPVCRQRVGRGNSLSVGFGNKIMHKKKNRPDDYYGEWEIGTYSASWRITKDARIIIGGQDKLGFPSECDQILQGLRLPPIVAVRQTTTFDVQVLLDEGIAIDFLAASSWGDETFHIFAPAHKYIEFRVGVGWKVGDSNVPWD